MKQLCVEWRERPSGGSGFCVEVSRDELATQARTLCGYFVVLPGASVRRKPTCAVCITKLQRSAQA